MNKRYNKNFALFASFSPLAAYRLQNEESNRLEFCKTASGDWNLVDFVGAVPFYFYSKQGALLEAQSWASIQPLDRCQVLFVYGIGLGYYYLPLKEWLEGDRSRAVVFIEEDGRVINAFLESELATEILQHPQVVVAFLPCLREREKLSAEDFWARLRVEASWLFWSFAPYVCQMSALQSYFSKFFFFFDRLVLQWYLNLSQARGRLSEFLEGSFPVFRNIYANLLGIGNSYSLKQMRGTLSKRPLILCGAGPSLEKQLPLIKQFENSALIAASGSAMNAVTRASIIPHFGAGVDPTMTQASRLLTSFAFEVPLFYKNRFCAEALSEWHGPHIFVPSAGGFRVERWFEKELSKPSGSHLFGGISTSNLLLELAGVLGLDPIILVGMDLAYSQNERYSAGVEVHPADTREEQIALKKKEEALLAVVGVDGKPVYTKQEWMFEAACMADFKQRHPHITFVNATEGGMPIETVLNTSLKEAVEQISEGHWDLEGWLHGSIQNAYDPIAFETILNALQKWKHSLETCQNLLSKLVDELKINRQRVKHGELLISGPYTGRAVLWEVELTEEPAYEYFLSTLDVVFNTYYRRMIDLSNRHFKGKRQQKIKLTFELERCVFLEKYLKAHISFVETALESAKKKKHCANKNSSSIALPNYIQEGRLKIDEPAIDLSLNAPFIQEKIPKSLWPDCNQATQVEALCLQKMGKNEGQTLYFYENGTIKVEAFYYQGKLQGPWNFYSTSGQLLVRSWFVEGKKEGITNSFYLDGALYSQKGYFHGESQGTHLFYYSDGTLKTVLPYNRGVLEGEVRLYHSNGQIKKEFHFLHGQLHGKEKSWLENGNLVLEAEYRYNRPVGIARSWYPNGKLAREAEYSDSHELIKYREWKENNKQFPPEFLPQRSQRRQRK